MKLILHTIQDIEDVLNEFKVVFFSITTKELTVEIELRKLKWFNIRKRKQLKLCKQAIYERKVLGVDFIYIETKSK